GETQSRYNENRVDPIVQKGIDEGGQVIEAGRIKVRPGISITIVHIRKPSWIQLSRAEDFVALLHHRQMDVQIVSVSNFICCPIRRPAIKEWGDKRSARQDADRAANNPHPQTTGRKLKHS